MDWEKFALNFGLPGLMLVAIGYVMKMWIASNEKVQLERIKVEDKKTDVDSKRADAMVTALTTLSGKIDNHQVTDIKSHQEMAEEIAGLHGKLDQAITDRTPVEGTAVRRSTPAQGVATSATEYGPFTRPKTGGR
jgi:hypothetical protein